MTRFYDLLPEKDKRIIDELCPYKIGDKIEVTRTVVTRARVNVYTWNCEIIDIAIEVPDDIENNDDAKILNMINPRFCLSCQYSEPLPRSRWWKFWEEVKNKNKSICVTVDSYGVCDTSLEPAIFYTVKKLSQQ